MMQRLRSECIGRMNRCYVAWRTRHARARTDQDRSNSCGIVSAHDGHPQAGALYRDKLEDDTVFLETSAQDTLLDSMLIHMLVAREMSAEAPRNAGRAACTNIR